MGFFDWVKLLGPFFAVVLSICVLPGMFRDYRWNLVTGWRKHFMVAKIVATSWFLLNNLFQVIGISFVFIVLGGAFLYDWFRINIF